MKLLSLEYLKYLLRRRQWRPTPVLLPGKSHGRRSLGGCRPWGLKESDTTEPLHFHFSLSCTGEGNGNPLQCSCLENPRDGGAWWAAVYGVAQSQTRLKQLCSSSSHWVNRCLGRLSTNSAVLLESVYQVRACLRGSARNVSSWSASGFQGPLVILALQFNVLPERAMSVAWERAVKHEWKLLETHLYQRF